MHLDIQREELLKAVRHAQRFCGNARTNPILANVLIRSTETAIEVAATDLTRSLRYRIAADRATSRVRGAVLVPVERLVGLLSSSSEPTASLRAAAEGGKVEVVLGRGRFNILAEDPQDFPELPSFPAQVDLVVNPGRALVDMGHKCAVATTRDEQRYSFDAVCLIVGPTGIQGVSTDGRRLVSVTVAAQPRSTFGGRKLIVPELLSLFGRLGPVEDPIELAFGERHVFLRGGFAEVAAIDREGKFPPIEKVFNKKPEFSVQVSRELFQQALQQVGFVLDDQENSVYLRLEDGAMIVHGQSSRGGQGRAELPCEGTPAEPFEVEFNPDLLVDFLKVMQDERIEIGFRAPTEQVLMRELESGVDYIVMPIRKEEPTPSEPAGAGATS